MPSRQGTQYIATKGTHVDFQHTPSTQVSVNTTLPLSSRGKSVKGAALVQEAIQGLWRSIY